MKIKNTNKLIVVDLDTSIIQISDLDNKLISKYLGGRGVNSYLLYQYTNQDTQPLSKDNVLIVGTGMLTGLKGLTFSRTTITAKSPESGLFGDANIGGGFGVSLRKLGYGYLVVKGKATTPVSIVIGNDKVVIEDASNLWGQDTQETQKIISDKYPASEALTIGPAGENKVVFACVINRRKNAAARCGMGAVMGSKNLKAIIALESKEEIEVEDSATLQNNLKEINQFLGKEFLMDNLKKYGSAHLYDIINESIGMGRVKNGRTLAFKENENISPENLSKFHTGRAGCQNCVVRCQHIYEYKGIKNEGPEYGVMAHFGPVLGLGRIENVLIFNEMINRLGVDASSTANVIAWAIELYTQGLIDKDKTGGLMLEWSNPDLIEELINDIAYRKNFGDFLAKGPRGMLEDLPKEAEDCLCWTKQLVQSEPVDLRCLPAYALSNSVASRGSDHLRSRPIWVAFEFPVEAVKDIYGGEVDVEALSYGSKGKIVYWWEHYLAMFDVLGICKFLGFHSLPPGIPFSFFANIVNAAYGLDVDEDDLKLVAERLINIERLYIQREGVSRKDDYPPQRVFEPLAERDGVREEDKDVKLDKEKYDKMLDEYYHCRGWDSQGRIEEETMDRLELKVRF